MGVGGGGSQILIFVDSVAKAQVTFLLKTGRTKMLQMIWHDVTDIIPRMAVQSHFQSLLVQIMT